MIICYCTLPAPVGQNSLGGDLSWKFWLTTKRTKEFLKINEASNKFKHCVHSFSNILIKWLCCWRGLS